MPAASSLISSWNPAPAAHLRQVRLEEDIRDALQSVRTRQPSLAQRKALLESSDQVGVQHAFLGFPAASQTERDRCEALAAHARQQALRIEPVFMARAVEADVAAVLEIRESSGARIAADIFIGVSALRLAAESWNVADVFLRLEKACGLARKQNLPFRISYEDSSRATPEVLRSGLHAAVALGASAVVLCDTAGDCVPEGAARHTAFAVDALARSGSGMEIGWHGHNDKGLSLANAWAAAQNGAHFISGTFLGVGERTGNTPLEQMVLLLADAGSTLYDKARLAAVCAQFASGAGIDIAPDAPLVGSDVFSTSTGTHVAAIVKGRELGGDFEDLMYSSVAAGSLGRAQSLLIGPGSGRAAVTATLLAFGQKPDPERVEVLLDLCKRSSRCFRGRDEILGALALQCGDGERSAAGYG